MSKLTKHEREELKSLVANATIRRLTAKETSAFVFDKLGVSISADRDKIESFIDNSNSDDVSPEKAVKYVNQLFAVSKEESIPPNQVSSYIQQKIQEKQNIEEAIKEADDIL